MKRLLMTVLLLALLTAAPAMANLPGGGTGTGPDVTIVNNNNGTVTMANGIVSILITISGATINQINYTYNNGGGTQTQQVLANGKDGGEFYWEFGGWGGNPWIYSVVTNTGGYAEVDMYSDSATNGLVDIHYSMLRGSPGFYVTPIWSHRPQDAAMGTGEERDNIYIAPYFNWQTVDNARDFEEVDMNNVPSFFSPQENSLVTSGNLEGTYVDKYKWSANLYTEHVWGWSSVSDAAWNFTGQNIGIWHVVASGEFYNGGPLKPDLNDAPMVNMINGGHYYMGTDSAFGPGESWTRVSGPYFIYLNNVTNTLTNPVQASRALWADAQAQAAAEESTWPYAWLNNPNYAPAAQRGTVTGRLVIADPGNPNATASNLWVGLVRQPATVQNFYDFQQWEKPYQFWANSDASGNFVISNVIAGNNYTLYAFGPGAEGTFLSQNQTGGNPPLLFNLPATPFSVTVPAAATNALGTITWTPSRVGPTVFEIGYPDRTGDKFRHGDDYWVGEIGPSPTAPSPVWTKFLDYKFDFPSGPNYVVGQSRWSTDWNFIQPVYPDASGNDISSSSTITFTLPSAPAGGAQASLYLGLASYYYIAMEVSVNGTSLGSVNGLSAAPNTSVPTSGYYPEGLSGDVSIREENHGAVTDERLTFPASQLHAGVNTITIGIRQVGGSYFADHATYDYVRLEMTGYVPPPPGSVTAYPGNSASLVSWPVTPGASSYHVLRSTSPTTGFGSITNGVTGPVCGSGWNNATFLDATAVNDTTYYYEVQSVNPAGASVSSPASAAVTPSATIATSAPAAPAGLTVVSTNNAVTLAWTPAPGASFYTIQRGTVVNRLGYVPFYTTLNNTNTSATYTDASGTLGDTYSYTVTATGPGGTSASSAAVTAEPVPPPPAAPPGNFSINDTITPTNQSNVLSWSAVPGAVGYLLFRSTSSFGPYVFPANYIQSMTTTTYTDGGLSPNTLYTYQVIAMNAGGVSGNSIIVSTPPAAPASLNAYSGNGQITLVWSPSVGATNYIIKRSTSSGAEVTLATTTNRTWLDSGLVNGVTYYYIVTAIGTGGASLNSPEAGTAPFSGTPAVYWIDAVTSAAQYWNVNSNWSNSTAFPNAAEATATVNAPIAAPQTINLNQPITVGALNLGSGGGTFTVAGNGGSLILDNTPGQPSLFELAASKGDTISAPVTLNGTLVISNASASPLTLAGAIGGNNGLLVAGPGTVVLAGTNTYAGTTAVGAATLQINSAAGASTNAILLTGGSTLYENTVSLGNVVNNTGTNTWTPYSSSSYYPGVSLTGSGLLYLNISGSGVFSPGGDWSQFAGTIAWAAGNGASCRLYGTLGSANAIWNLGASTGSIYNRNGGVTISFGALLGGPGTSLYGASSAGVGTTYAVGALNQNSIFNGHIFDGGYAGAFTTLSKVGTGTLTLTATNNTYSGGTTISAGTLLVDNLAGTGVGVGAVTVASGGTLGGTGIVTGTVNVSNGGTLAPGSPAGSLTISNSLVLATGSTALFQVQHSPLTNTLLTISGNLTEGGTLIVTNSGGTALAEGDMFKLFNAGSHTGSFASVALPALPAGLAWNTNALATSGTLSVVVTTHPVFGPVTFANGALVLAGTAGVANASFYLLGSTNLATPLANWTRLLTNQFDGSGNFDFTNLISPTNSPMFYRLQVP